MKEYTLCPTCGAPHLKGEACTRCAERLAAEARAAKVEAHATEQHPLPPMGEASVIDMSQPAVSLTQAPSQSAFATIEGMTMPAPGTTAPIEGMAPPSDATVQIEGMQAPAANVPYTAPDPAAVRALFEETKPEEPLDGREYQRLMDRTHAPLSSWSICGLFFLFAIPLIGWIFAIVFACGGCKKHQKTLFARGFLLYTLLTVVVACILALIGILWLSAPIVAFLKSLLGAESFAALQSALPFFLA